MGEELDLDAAIDALADQGQLPEGWWEQAGADNAAALNEMFRNEYGLGDDGSHDAVTNRIAADAAQGTNIWNSLSAESSTGSGLLNAAKNLLGGVSGNTWASLLAGGIGSAANASLAREMLAAKLAGAAASDARKEAMTIAAEKRAEERKAADRKRYSDSITGMTPIRSGHQSALRTTSGRNVYDERGRMQ